jgi:mono/diheme cytochrome c family protein
MNKLFWIFIFLLMAACKVQTGTDESSRFQVFNYANSKVDFAAIRDNVLKPQCMQCHSWSTNETEVIKRIVPGDPSTSALYKIVLSGQMPAGKPRLTDQSLGMLEQYILHVNSNQAIKPIPLAATYASLKVHLFEKSCTRCHNPDVRIKHTKRPLLTSKEAIIARFDDILYSMTDAWNMNDNEMPPATSDVPRVSEEVINMLIKWKDAGFVD